jgi:hypothetical protein
MWFSYLPIIALVAGIVIAIFGAGPIGIVLAIIGVIGLVAKVAGSYAGQGRTSDESGPEPVPGGHKATGHAHPGQEHMVP